MSGDIVVGASRDLQDELCALDESERVSCLRVLTFAHCDRASQNGYDLGPPRAYRVNDERGTRGYIRNRLGGT